MSITVTDRCKMCHTYVENAQINREFYETNGFVCANCINLWANIEGYPLARKSKKVSRFDLMDI